jgi:hypothetical protein
MLMKDERQETSALHHGENVRRRVSLVRPLKRESDNEVDRFAETILDKRQLSGSFGCS